LPWNFELASNGYSGRRNKYEEETDGLPEAHLHQVPNDIAAAAGAEFDAINYFESRLTEADLRSLLKKLGLCASQILRQHEPVAKELGIGKRDFSEDELIALMAKHPDLIQRPIVVCGDQAVLGRSPENVEKLL
jgi:arsenate reductase (glutaredoxin)